MEIKKEEKGKRIASDKSTSKLVNVDAEVISNLQEFITSVYSLCDAMSLLGSIKIRNSIIVDLPNSFDQDKMIEVNNKYHLIDRLNLPLNIQGREFLLPVVFRLKSVIPFIKTKIYQNGSDTTNIRNVISDVVESLDLLGFTHSDINKYMKR